MRLPRIRKVDPAAFMEEHMVGNAPVIVTDGMDGWPARDLWSPEYLIERFGSARAQIYGDAFRPIMFKPLQQYFERFFYKSYEPGSGSIVPYVRWYSRMRRDSPVPWADGVFEALRDDWSMPYFLPVSGYLMPFCPPNRTISPTDSLFPARAIFISPQGGRTRLHLDQWQSDAVLCQLYGGKTLKLYAPDQARYLANGDRVVNPDDVDAEAFPDYAKAKVTFEDTLSPGEMVYIPNGWYHDFTTISASISLTWNFVHMSTWESFYRYARSDPPEADRETLAFFLGGAGEA